MATSSHITMLREISAAGDRERTGALDVEWEGAHATLFFMFGHPSHVVYETTDGRKLDGEAALDAIVDELPTDFRVAPWRRAMVTDDTLHCSAEDLMGLFQRRNTAVESNGRAAEPPAPATTPPVESFAAAGTAPSAPPTAPVRTDQPPFGLSDFPLLPRATALWTDAAANVVNLAAAVPRLPDCFLVLDGPTCHGAAVISGGRVTEAVWVNGAGGELGDAAAHAVMNSLVGTLTAYTLDDARLASALPMLWRAPRLGVGLPAPWLHTDDIVAEVRTSGRTCGLLVDSADSGVALFADGELVAVYTASQQWPATSMAALRSLLHEPGARVSVIGDLAVRGAAAALDGLAPATEPEAVAEAEPEPELEAVAEAEPEALAEPEPEALAEPESEAVAEPAPDAVVEPEPEAVAEPEPEAVADTEPEALADTEPEALAEPEPEPEAVAEPAPQTKGRGKSRGKGKAAKAAEVETATNGAAAEDVAAALEEFTPVAVEAPQATPAGAGDFRFEPAVFTISDLSGDSAPESNGMAAVEAREATEFVPARLDIDVDALRAELTDIATVWLGEDDAAPVAHAIGAARPGVDDFVSTIAAIGTMEIPGHETAVVRAMAREMHFRASEVLCGV